MDYGHLNIQFEAWKQHGLDYLLADEALPANFSICMERQAQAVPSVQRNAQATQRQAPVNQAPVNPATVNRAPTRKVASAQGRVPAQTQNTQPVQSAQTQYNQSNNLPFLPAEHWPSAWQARIEQTAPAPILWTYWSLADDLGGKASPARREFMRKLIADLGHVRGTNTFWPAALAEQDNVGQGSEDLVPNMQAFWSGVQLLKSRAIVVMGQPAAKALGLPTNLRPFMQTRHNGCFVVVLRDVDFLIEEPHLYGNVREFLRRALTPFVR